MPDPLKVDYNGKLYPVLNSFLNCTKRLPAIMGPFGSGKSVGCVMKLMDLANSQEPGTDGIRHTRWAVVRNTYRQLEDTTEKTFFDWFPPAQCGNFNQTKHNYKINGKDLDGVPFQAEFLFRALDRPDHVRNLLSLELTGGWVNEAREVPWEVIKVLPGRTNRYPKIVDGGCTWHGVVMDTNPPDEDSDFYKFFEENRPASAEIFKQPSGLSEFAENRHFQAPTYWTDMLDMFNDEEIKVYVHGQYGFLQSGKPVYDAYKDNLHCKDVKPIKRIITYRLWDFGLTPACVFMQITPEGHIILFYEMTTKRSGIDKFSDEVKLFCGTHLKGFHFEDIGDPAGAAAAQTDEVSCFDVLQGKGIDIQPGESAIKIRLESVDYALRTLLDDGSPMLLVDPKCKMLRKGFLGGYQHKKSIIRDTAGDPIYALKPDKNKYSHPHDAVQHGLGFLLGDLLRDRKSGLDLPPGVDDGYNEFDNEEGGVIVDSHYDPFA